MKPKFEWSANNPSLGTCPELSARDEAIKRILMYYYHGVSLVAQTTECAAQSRMWVGSSVTGDELIQGSGATTC